MNRQDLSLGSHTYSPKIWVVKAEVLEVQCYSQAHSVRSVKKVRVY